MLASICRIQHLLVACAELRRLAMNMSKLVMPRFSKAHIMSSLEHRRKLEKKSFHFGSAPQKTCVSVMITWAGEIARQSYPGKAEGSTVSKDSISFIGVLMGTPTSVNEKGKNCVSSTPGKITITTVGGKGDKRCKIGNVSVSIGARFFVDISSEIGKSPSCIKVGSIVKVKGFSSSCYYSKSPNGSNHKLIGKLEDVPEQFIPECTSHFERCNDFPLKYDLESKTFIIPTVSFSGYGVDKVTSLWGEGAFDHFMKLPLKSFYNMPRGTTTFEAETMMHFSDACNGLDLENALEKVTEKVILKEADVACIRDLDAEERQVIENMASSFCFAHDPLNHHDQMVKECTKSPFSEDGDVLAVVHDRITQEEPEDGGNVYFVKKDPGGDIAFHLEHKYYIEYVNRKVEEECPHIGHSVFVFTCSKKSFGPTEEETFSRITGCRKMTRATLGMITPIMETVPIAYFVSSPYIRSTINDPDNQECGDMPTVVRLPCIAAVQLSILIDRCGIPITKDGVRIGLTTQGISFVVAPNDEQKEMSASERQSCWPPINIKVKRDEESPQATKVGKYINAGEYLQRNPKIPEEYDLVVLPETHALQLKETTEFQEIMSQNCTEAQKIANTKHMLGIEKLVVKKDNASSKSVSFPVERLQHSLKGAMPGTCGIVFMYLKEQPAKDDESKKIIFPDARSGIESFGITPKFKIPVVAKEKSTLNPYRHFIEASGVISLDKRDKVEEEEEKEKDAGKRPREAIDPSPEDTSDVITESSPEDTIKDNAIEDHPQKKKRKRKRNDGEK